MKTTEKYCIFAIVEWTLHKNIIKPYLGKRRPPPLNGAFSFNIMEEIWKDLVDFEGYYEVSNTGFVRRKSAPTFYKDGRIAYFSQNVLKAGIDHKGYLRVFLSVKSKKYSKRVHRLVAKTFIENNFNLPQVNHKDCNKQNNHESNLEWITNIENMRHAFANGIFIKRDNNNTKKK